MNGHASAARPEVANRAAFQADLGPAAGPGESAHARRRRDRGGATAAADGRDRRRPRADRPGRAADPARRIRGAPAADRLLLHVEPGPARGRAVRGLHLLSRTRSRELSYLHSRDITYAVFCQGPYEESLRYRDFMGWEMPWYSAQPSPRAASCRSRTRSVPPRLLPARRRPGLRDLLDETARSGGDGLQLRADGPDRVRTPGIVGGLAAGRPQERTNARTEGGPPDWPPVPEWPGGRPIAQWPRLEAGRSDDLGTARTSAPAGSSCPC